MPFAKAYFYINISSKAYRDSWKNYELSSFKQNDVLWLFKNHTLMFTLISEAIRSLHI